MTIADGIFYQIFLMFFLGAVEIFNRLALYRNLVEKIPLQFVERFANNGRVVGVAVVNARTVLQIVNAALLVDNRRVYRLVVNRKELG